MKKKKKRKIKEKRRGGRQLIKLSVHRSSPTSVILRDENDTGEDHLLRIISFVSRSLKWTRSYTSKKKTQVSLCSVSSILFPCWRCCCRCCVYTHTHSIFIYVSRLSTMCVGKTPSTATTTRRTTRLLQYSRVQWWQGSLLHSRENLFISILFFGWSR